MALLVSCCGVFDPSSGRVLFFFFLVHSDGSVSVVIVLLERAKSTVLKMRLD